MQRPHSHYTLDVLEMSWMNGSCGTTRTHGTGGTCGTTRRHGTGRTGRTFELSGFLDVFIIEVEPLPVAVDRRWMLPIPLPQSLPIVSLSTFESEISCDQRRDGSYHAMLGILIEMFDKIPAHHRRRQLRECEMSDWQAKGCLNVTSSGTATTVLFPSLALCS
ncbi:hypothetical protein BDN67DRAFT_538551 [Paxillus ammoniavirescens]|nr:hypothetical protein BDN67DRAFT_538551 [Paxillus ammoniavirescens]